MMIDSSSRVSRSVVPVGVMCVTAVTMVMNAKFGYSLGSDDLERWAFVALGVGVDVCKVFGLGFIVSAFAKKDNLKGVLGLVVWLSLVSYSFVAGIGFASMTRSNITAERVHENEKINAAKQAVKTKLADIERMTSERDVMKENQRYVSTAGCSVPKERMKPESALYCDNYFAKYNEILEAQKEIPGLRAAIPKDEVIKDADPQMSFFAANLGFTLTNMVAIWAVYMAIIAELVSSVGTYAFSPTRAKSRSSDKQVPEIAEKKKRGRPVGSVNKPKLRVVN